jgi:phosphocarrier protein FPr/phosphocarrier protein
MASAHEEGRTADGTASRSLPIWASWPKPPRLSLAGAEGCGLLRTEFLFLDRQRAR